MSTEKVIAKEENISKHPVREYIAKNIHYVLSIWLFWIGVSMVIAARLKEDGIAIWIGIGTLILGWFLLARAVKEK